MKKIFSALISITMLLSLTACGDENENLGTVEMATTVTTQQPTVETTEAVPGVRPEDGIYDAGYVTVNVPVGWKVFPMYKVLQGKSDEKSTSSFRISKGAEVENDLNTTPFIQIDFCPAGHTMDRFTTETFGGGDAVGPVVTGELEWDGFEVMMDTQKKLILLYSADAEGNQYQAAIWAELIGGKISLEDSDVIEILSSLRASE